LVEWREQGHLFDGLFTPLVEVAPEAFHPFLSRLDPRREPEGLAFVHAPLEGLASHLQLLAGSREAPARVGLEPGTIARAIDAHRDLTAAANPEGGALLAAVRSMRPESLAAVEAWFQRASPDARDEAFDLVLGAGCVFTAQGKVVQLHGDAAYSLAPAPPRKSGFFARTLQAVKGGGAMDQAQLWGPAGGSCPLCKAPLLSVLRVPAALVPGALRSTAGEVLAVVTCRHCVPLEASPYFVRLGEKPEMVPGEEPRMPIDPLPQPGAVEVPQAVAVALVAAPRQAGFMFAVEAELTRVGGAPSWVQNPEVVTCPQCHGVMPFVAQVADPPGDLWSGDTGMLFAFLCGQCRVVGTLTQCC
jgi:hypothetical protein